MKTSTSIEWLFGGGLSGQPWAAWLLGILLTVFLGVVLVSYHRTLRALTPAHRWTLVVLRAGFLITLFLCLANPARVERRSLDATPRRPLAVLVDRSDSMTTPDNRHRSRLDGAAKIWPSIQSVAGQKFSEVRYQAFGRESIRADNFSSALQATVDGSNSSVFSSLKGILDSAPPGGLDALLTFTDGLDTTKENADDLVSRAIAAHTALYFVPGENRLSPNLGWRVREIRVPASVLRHSQFEYEAIIEGYSATAREMPVELWSGDHSVGAGKLQVTAGLNLISWKQKLSGGETGLLPLEIRLATQPQPLTAHSEVNVVASNDLNLLYYQGGLDWGFRFLANVLQRDPSFQITAFFNPATQIHITSSVKNSQVRTLPSTAAELEPFQIIILTNVSIDQLSENQQKALAEYVKNGGSLLFIIPDNKAASALAGSTLETMLPVVFEAPVPLSTRENAAERFQQRMHNSTNNEAESDFGEQAVGRTRRILLQPFSFPPESGLAALFSFIKPDGSVQKIVPQFAEYASVSQSKPGATILAVHPQDLDPSSKTPRILLATQTFGKGRSSVLNTDSLWRWKMSLASGSKETEVFWQQLLRWLAGAQNSGIHFTTIPTTLPLQEKATLAIEGVTRGEPSVEAVAPDGKVIPLEHRPDNSRWLASFKPDQPGEWKITARTGHDSAAIFISATEQIVTPEKMNLPPDLPLMQRLAAATGGEVLSREVPAGWRQKNTETSGQILSEQRTLLWNNWWILAAGLALYSLELLLRRFWRLL